MTRADDSLEVERAVVLIDGPETDIGELDRQMLRISRIGKRLFNVAQCVIVLGGSRPQPHQEHVTAAMLERDFCAGLPLSKEPLIASDARMHPLLKQYGAVEQEPHVRFVASHPVHNHEGVRAGSITLLDYAPRQFVEDDRYLLTDLAGLVERELQFRSMDALQLDLQKKNKNLRRKSLVDPLIGTWNRGAIMRILTIEAIRCDRAGQPLSLIVVDLDYFKKINDNYGHPVGDAALIKVASRLRSCIRPQEALGRYGGEEFLIVLPGASHKTAMAVAERMRLAIAAQPEFIGGVTLNLSISAGVASTDLFPATTTEELINHADMALYAAKDAGRNCVVNATPDLI